MDIPRGTMSLALPLPPSPESHFPRDRTTSRFSSHSPNQHSRPREAMAIPGARTDTIPPALPPPRYNEDLANGHDVAWHWGNSERAGNTGILAPIRAGSSLLGGQQYQRQPYSHRSGRRSRSLEEDEAQDMDLDVTLDRPGSIVTIRSAVRPETDKGTHMPHLVRRGLSPSTLSPRFQSGKALAHQSHIKSSHAYDQSLLSKIGKSATTPPGHSRSNSNDNPVPAQKLSLQIRDPGSCRRQPNEPSSASDVLTKCLTSPESSAVSAGSKSSWRDSNGMERRSSSSIDSTTNSAPIDLELFNVYSSSATRTPARHPQPGPVSRSEDSRHRSSYDASMYRSDAEFLDEESHLRACHLDDRDPRDIRHGQGIKRRALSPPSEALRDSRPEQYQRVNASSFVSSPSAHHPSKHGSFSSTGSSARHNSLASSAAFSGAPSSMTSISSLDTHGHLEQRQNSPYITSAPPTSSPTGGILPLRKMQDKPATSKMSLQSNMSDLRPAPSRIGNHFICACCPKKPKKFETEEQLRAHENEKQYVCAYCQNRFKNKNEAERHQNSLHLRKYSWSCSAIVTPQAAFHPTPSSNPHHALTDTCGFCGDEFTNQPPNWDQRIDHLTNVHKFGECNSVKKFFRADHFRQHLKHSHAGKSGKWTNTLEQTCLRGEEGFSEPASLSPTASEHSQSGASVIGRGPSSLPDPANTPMGGVTINEAYEEP